MKSLLHPVSVCIVGASADPHRLAGKPLQRLRRHAFGGSVYLVNPRYDEIAGFGCFPSVSALPEPVDVALVAVAARLVPGVVRECGARGIRNVVVLSSGFEEDSEGAGLVAELREAVRASGVRLVGPNCEGIWSIPDKLALTFGSAADRDTFVAGPVSVISQSGSIGGACMRELQDRGIGCRYFVSTGNETDTTALDFCEYMIAEETSTVIAMFLEGIRDGGRLRELGHRARERGITLIALRAGTSDLGRLAIASHTGRIATAEGVYRDIFRQHGILEVTTFTELIQAIEFACIPMAVGAPRGGAGTGTGIIAVSGGSRALLADSSARRGVPLAEFTDETVRELTASLPQFGYARNPADVTGQILSDPAIFTKVATIVAQDANTDSLLIQYANGAEHQLRAHADLLAEVTAITGKPVAVSLLGGGGEQIGRSLRERGIIYARDPDEAIMYLSWFYQRSRSWVAPAPGPTGPASTVGQPAGTAPDRLSDWPARAEFLQRAGVAVPRWAITGPGDDPADVMAAAGLRFPLVAKALPETAEHKTERGLVVLDVRDHEQLTAALGKLAKAIGAPAPILLQEMVSGGVEVLLSVRRDRDFGPLLALGSGGAYTEWLADLGHVQLPASREEIIQALARLRLWKLLQPFRGRDRCDVAALAEVAYRLAAAYLAELPEGWEIEINPLMVFPEGREPAAVDVLCSPPPAEREGVGQ